MKHGLRRDYYAGALMVLLGVGAAFEGRRYDVGTLTHMGPGFFPTALGVLLALLGILIAGAAMQGEATDGAVFVKPDWRGWLCITAGAVLFIVLAGHGGLVPATFASVFVAALGDRTNRLREAALLAAGITVFGTVLFAYGLRIEIPIFGSL